MSVEQLVQFVTLAVAIVATVAIRLMTSRAVVNADAMLVLAWGLLGVTWLATTGPLTVGPVTISAQNVATFNRAFVAAVMSVIAVKMTVRRWESRHGRGRRET